MELMEDLMKRIQTCVKAEETREQLFPPEGKKMSKVKKCQREEKIEFKKCTKIQK